MRRGDELARESDVKVAKSAITGFGGLSVSRRKPGEILEP